MERHKYDFVIQGCDLCPETWKIQTCKYIRDSLLGPLFLRSTVCALCYAPVAKYNKGFSDKNLDFDNKCLNSLLLHSTFNPECECYNYPTWEFIVEKPRCSIGVIWENQEFNK